MMRLSSNDCLSPCSVFEEGMYAGDARLSDLPCQAKTLLAYAMDLKMAVHRSTASPPQETVRLQVRRGTLLMSRCYEDTTTYTIHSARDAVRELIVEHPIRPNWTLTAPSGTIERTRNMYRIRQQIPTRQTQTLTIREERREDQHLALSSLAKDRIQIFLKQKYLSEALRQALDTLVNLQQQRADLVLDIHRHKRQLKDIITEQGRLRENMGTVAPNSESYFMWERKLVEQESVIEATRAEIPRAHQALQEKQNEINAFLLQLNID